MDRHTHRQTDGQTHSLPIIITTAGNERRSIAKCTVIITYLNDNAQTPLDRFVVHMLYKQVCNKHDEKSNRWSLCLSVSHLYGRPSKA